eukprot:4199498-Prymnesium_polylepis.1
MGARGRKVTGIGHASAWERGYTRAQGQGKGWTGHKGACAHGRTGARPPPRRPDRCILCRATPLTLRVRRKGRRAGSKRCNEVLVAKGHAPS